MLFWLLDQFVIGGLIGDAGSLGAPVGTLGFWFYFLYILRPIKIKFEYFRDVKEQQNCWLLAFKTYFRRINKSWTQETLSNFRSECRFTSSIFRLRLAAISSFVASLGTDTSVPRILERYRKNILGYSENKPEDISIR